MRRLAAVGGLASGQDLGDQGRVGRAEGRMRIAAVAVAAVGADVVVVAAVEADANARIGAAAADGADVLVVDGAMAADGDEAEHMRIAYLVGPDRKEPIRMMSCLPLDTARMRHGSDHQHSEMRRVRNCRFASSCCLQSDGDWQLLH